ncbi:MAG: dihydrodipicolinate synthase family protein [Burkholderiaceae bacterium]
MTAAPSAPSAPNAHPRQRFAGVYPVLYAYFRADGRLDPSAMRLQVAHCIAQGAHGITVLGLVTEVHRIDAAERRELVEVVGDAIGGRLPYAVTIAEPSPAEQVAAAAHANLHGADWVILQPPPGAGHSDADLARHFARVAERIELPVAIQNNPVNLASSMSPNALAALVNAHDNITLLKAEGWSIDIARVIEACHGDVDAFGGHGGVELISLMRSGGRGLIPAPDCLALQVAMFDALDSGDLAREAAALKAHKELLPLIVLMTRSLAGILTYGKRLMAQRLGLAQVHDRPGIAPPTAFGLAEVERVFADVLAAERQYLAPMRGETAGTMKAVQIA